MERVRVGCAGWSIPSARSALFPREGTHLQRYAAVFDCVEINSSFYRPHRPATYRQWAASVPETFRFSAKLPRTITHYARLRHCDSLLERFLAQVEQLDYKLGFLLVQLPPSLAFDEASALRFFDHLAQRHSGPVACEPRHRTWFEPAVDEALRERGIARVAADPAPVPEAAVAGGDPSLRYMRLHGSPRMYYDAYPESFLDRIAGELAQSAPSTRTCWCIFDNTALGHAIGDAAMLRRKLASMTDTARCIARPGATESDAVQGRAVRKASRS